MKTLDVNTPTLADLPEPEIVYEVPASWLDRLDPRFVKLCIVAVMALFAVCLWVNQAGAASPNGYKAWCMADAYACPVVEPVTVPYTPELGTLMIDARKASLFDVRHEKEPVAEDGERMDIWRYPVTGEGDCEDRAIWIRDYLHKHGVPLGAMRFAAHYQGEGHTWLTVRTDRGDLAVDWYEVAPAGRFHAQPEAVESYACAQGVGCTWRSNTVYPTTTTLIAHTQDRR